MISIYPISKLTKLFLYVIPAQQHRFGNRNGIFLDVHREKVEERLEVEKALKRKTWHNWSAALSGFQLRNILPCLKRLRQPKTVALGFYPREIFHPLAPIWTCLISRHWAGARHRENVTIHRPCSSRVFSMMKPFPSPVRWRMRASPLYTFFLPLQFHPLDRYARSSKAKLLHRLDCWKYFIYIL